MKTHQGDEFAVIKNRMGREVLSIIVGNTYLIHFFACSAQVSAW